MSAVTVTGSDARRLLRLALIDLSESHRKLAAGHSMTGQANAAARARLRAERQKCMVLAKHLDRVSAVQLAVLLNLPVGES